jgi:uncharacterized OB-fold protein
VIDPKKLREQQSVVSVLDDRRFGDSRPHEVKCSRCGRRTRNPTGVCARCTEGHGLKDPKALSTEQLVAYVKACQVELRQRRAEIDGALGDVA